MNNLPKLYNIDLKNFIYPILYILIGYLTYKLIDRVIEKSFTKHTFKTLKDRHNQKRLETIKTLISNLLKYLIIIFVALAILSLYGINVKSILAGVGITAAIVGLACQDIAKDLLAGIFIVAEDQYEIGDTIEIDGFMGEVVFIGLKTTRIKDYKGRVKIISNHTITEVINYNLNNSLAIVDVSVGYEEDNDKVETVLTELVSTLSSTIPHSKGEAKLLGIDNLGDSAVVYRITSPVASNKQFEAERIMRKEIKKVLDQEQIKIPYPQIEVHSNGK